MQSLFGDGGRGARRETHNREHSLLIAGIGPHGQPDTVVSPPAETRGHDADDGVRLIIQTKNLADRVRVASEKPLPTSEAEHGDHFRLTGCANIRRLNRAADERWDSQKVKRIAREPN